jgi:exonuclease III
MTRLGGPMPVLYHSFSSLFLVASLYFLQCARMDLAEQIRYENQIGNLENADFPLISIAALNVNTLNMGTVTKHVRLRKFYGICSLKTDVICVSDIRLCNKNGLYDSKFVNETFAINPHCSYNLFHNSKRNCRGVGILVKKSLNLTCLELERDEATDNYILMKAKLDQHTVIIGSIYGPSTRDDDFFDRLCISLRKLGDFPTILCGDWNTTFSCLPLQENPDIINMSDLPNSKHAKLVRNICNEFKLTDPFRILWPNKIDFSYAPWGNVRNNRSRLDFF